MNITFFAEEIKRITYQKQTNKQVNKNKDKRKKERKKERNKQTHKNMLFIEENVWNNPMKGYPSACGIPIGHGTP